MKRDKEAADGQMAEESVVGAESKETDGEDEDDDISMINVDFEFFDPNPDVDFHAFNTLLKQLFGPDAVQFDLGSLADLILSNPAMGSTVKVDGKESDPYAMLSVIPISSSSSSNTNTNTNTASETNQVSPVIFSMRPYILSKTKKDAAFAKLLAGIMSDGSKARIGLILSERLINMPVEVVPPMYRMLAEEIQKASTDSEIYKFDYYILWSKSYQEIVSKLDEEDDRPKKKGKQNKISSKEVFFFHPEDEIMAKHATHRVTFQFSRQNEESDSKRTFHDFGIQPAGELMIIEKTRMAQAIQELQTTYPF